MLKNILKLGSTLNKNEQQSIKGGNNNDCDGCYDRYGICVPFSEMFEIPESCDNY